MGDGLPEELTSGAISRNGEYAWEPSAFPSALQQAPGLGYACLGGQFWFLLPDNSLYEPFWLDADSSDKHDDEPWSEYAKRSCEEVLTAFKVLIEKDNFHEEALKFETLKSPFRLMFNAYFVTELEFHGLGLHTYEWPSSKPDRR